MNDYITDMENFKAPFLCYDVGFRKVFSGLDRILIRMFADIAGIDYEVLRNNTLILNNEEVIKDDDVKARKRDFILRVHDDHTLSLELNTDSLVGDMYKSFSKLFDLYGFYEETSNGRELIRVYINVYKDRAYNISGASDIRKLYVHNDNSTFSNIITIFDFSLPKCYEMYCNDKGKKDIPRNIRWGALLYCDDVEVIKDILDSLIDDEDDKDNEKKIFIERFNALDRDELHLTDAEMYNIDSKRRIDFMYDRFVRKQEEKRKKDLDDNLSGKDKKEVDDLIEHVCKNLVKRNMSVEDIADVVGMSVEDISSFIDKY